MVRVFEVQGALTSFRESIDKLLSTFGTNGEAYVCTTEYGLRYDLRQAT